MTYYQLSQTDYDGVTVKLGMIGIQNTSLSKDIQLHPNPANESTALIIPAYKQKDITIRITDITGKIIEEKNTTLRTGDNYFDLKLSFLVKGMYFIQVEGRDVYQTLKLIKE